MSVNNSIYNNIMSEGCEGRIRWEKETSDSAESSMDLSELNLVEKSIDSEEIEKFVHSMINDTESSSGSAKKHFYWEKIEDESVKIGISDFQPSQNGHLIPCTDYLVIGRTYFEDAWKFYQNQHYAYALCSLHNGIMYLSQHLPNDPRAKSLMTEINNFSNLIHREIGNMQLIPNSLVLFF